MPVTIVATPGAANANSYVTLAEADAYADTRLNAEAWTAASADTRNRALVEATRTLTPLPWAGERVTSTQTLAWPREAAVDPDAPWVETMMRDTPGEFAPTVVPQRVKDATCELALQYVKAGTTDLAVADSAAGVVREKVDVIEVQYGAGGKASGVSALTRVWALVSPLLAVGSAGGASRWERA